ncbi:MAG TPA: hypothetical protein VKY85_02090 [Candidatus Angelobacter sp.]|nr:hypothetical protein [Candidatus Angelobacter sp.]
MRKLMNINAIRPSLLVVVILAACAFAKDKEPGVLELQGEIMDSQCAYNVHSTSHSHDSMTKKGIYGHDARSCTLHCSKESGGVLVLLVKEDVYRLDNQVQSERFAGKKVKVSGTLDEKTHTLHVFKMEEDR